MSPHTATNLRSDVLSPVADRDQGREVQSSGGSPDPLERHSRNGQLRKLRQHFHRETVGERERQSGDRQLCLLAYSLVLRSHLIW